MEQTVTLTETETAIIVHGLEQWAEKMDALGTTLIEKSNSRQAGFNCYDEAQEGRVLAERLSAPYPEREW